MFSIDLSKEERGLLWGFWEVLKQKETGRLVLKTSSSSRAELTKEIWFLSGEPMAVKSNWAQDSLRFFGGHHLLESEKSLSSLWSNLEAISHLNSFAQEVLKQGLLNPMDLQSFLHRYFRERLFNALSLRRGSLIFETMDSKQIPAEVVRLEKPFLMELWKQVLLRLDVPYCKSRFARHLRRSFRIKSDLPFNLDPKELRVWNQMKSKQQPVSELEEQAIQLLMVAHEFDLIEWEADPVSKLESELKDLIQRFEKATPFEILRVKQDAQAEEIKASHLEYIKKFHPDRISIHHREDLRSLAEQVMSQVNEAFSILSDPIKRQDLIDEIELKKLGGVEGITKRLEAEAAFEEARRLMSRKSYSAALKILENSCVVFKNDLEYRVELEFARYILKKDADETMKPNSKNLHQLLDQCMQEFASYESAYYYKALLYRFESENEKAVEFFQALLKRNPQHQGAILELRSLQLKANNPQDPSRTSWFRKKT